MLVHQSDAHVHPLSFRPAGLLLAAIELDVVKGIRLGLAAERNGHRTEDEAGGDEQRCVRQGVDSIECKPEQTRHESSYIFVSLLLR